MNPESDPQLVAELVSALDQGQLLSVEQFVGPVEVKGQPADALQANHAAQLTSGWRHLGRQFGLVLGPQSPGV